MLRPLGKLRGLGIALAALVVALPAALLRAADETAPQQQSTPSQQATDLPPGSPAVALDGFCPVQLTENERWDPGDRRWYAIHDGRTYLFAGPEERSRFLANPARYAPVQRGDDIVKLKDEGKHVAGSRMHGAWFRGKVYLFVSEDSYQQFDKNPFRFVSTTEEAGSEHKDSSSKKIPRVATATGLAQQETSLAWIPDNAAFYVSLLNCRQQIDTVRQSKAWERLMKLPAVVDALKQYQKQSEDPETPAGKVQSGLANPQIQSALTFLADLLGQEAFVYGDPNCIDLLRLFQTINGANQAQTISQVMRGAAAGSEAQQQHAAALLHMLAQNVELLKVPNTIAGFHITDKQQARQNLDVVAGFLALGSAMVPELNGRFSRKTVANNEYLVLSLDGKLIPWDKVPLDEMREHEIEKGDTDKVVAKLKGLTLVLAMGLRDDYLIAATVESTERPGRAGDGKAARKPAGVPAADGPR